VLEDQNGPWWSASINAQGANAVLNVNGSSIEIPSPGKHEYDFHLFLDGSVAELILNRRHAITTRIYRKPDGPLYLKYGDKNEVIASIEIWQLQPISPDRLTT
jgi:hypothetical protein